MRCVIILLLVLTSVSARAAPLTVFAAASLTDAMKVISGLWTQAGHPAPALAFGSSASLARQIEQGAPASLFASADLQWMDYLAKADQIAAGTRRNLLGNALVLIAPRAQARPVTISTGFNLSALLGPDGRLAIGDPAHVPIGLYARQALQQLGIWDSIKDRIAATADVRAGLLLVERGEAPLGIVYATDAALSDKVAVDGVFPASSHAPIIYPFAVTKAGDDAQARAFLDFLAGPEARTVWVRFGFKVE
jgi:molybdate transport system substrate-binding protein